MKDVNSIYIKLLLGAIIIFSIGLAVLLSQIVYKIETIDHKLDHITCSTLPKH